MKNGNKKKAYLINWWKELNERIYSQNLTQYLILTYSVNDAYFYYGLTETRDDQENKDKEILNAVLL